MTEYFHQLHNLFYKFSLAYTSKRRFLTTFLSHQYSQFLVLLSVTGLYCYIVHKKVIETSSLNDLISLSKNVKTVIIFRVK